MSIQINNPLLSVIMPVYNSKDFVGATIDTILEQSFTDFELIIINDGSTDGSAELLNKYTEIDKRIRVYHVKNGGPSKARNIGLDNACGQWIQFVDSDDQLDKEMMNQHYLHSENNDLVVSGVLDKDLDSGSVKARNLSYVKLSDKSEIGNYIVNMDISSKRICLNYLWNKWFRRSVIENCKLRFDESLRLGEDFVFISEFFKNINSVEILNKAYYNYCYHGSNSLTGRFDPNELKRRDIMYNVFKELLENFNVLDKGNNLLMLNEGMHLLKGMSKINLPSCKLSKKEKIEYIRAFLNEPYKKRMLCYLKNSKGFINTIKKVVIMSSNPKLIYFMYKRG